jgi:hypothetical protein
MSEVAFAHDRGRNFFREMLVMTAGPLLWIVHLIVLWGVTEFYCTRVPAWGPGGERLIGAFAVAITLAALAASAWLLWRSWRRLGATESLAARRFVAWVTSALWGFALIAITWTALPLLLAPSCTEPESAASSRAADQ